MFKVINYILVILGIAFIALILAYRLTPTEKVFTADPMSGIIKSGGEGW